MRSLPKPNYSLSKRAKVSFVCLRWIVVALSVICGDTKTRSCSPINTLAAKCPLEGPGIRSQPEQGPPIHYFTCKRWALLHCMSDGCTNVPIYALILRVYSSFNIKRYCGISDFLSVGSFEQKTCSTRHRLVQGRLSAVTFRRMGILLAMIVFMDYLIPKVEGERVVKRGDSRAGYGVVLTTLRGKVVT